MITRFAPSPTGPLHLGHAYSALLAHDMARAAGGTFLLRIENIDPQRSRPEWEAQILEDLEWLGIRWDAPPLRQSDRMDAYEAALDSLWARRLLYGCTCTRRDIDAALSAPQEGAPGPDGPIYPGTCRDLPRPERRPRDRHLRLDMAKLCCLPGLLPVVFEEIGPLHCGRVETTAETYMTRIGDIILSRKDFGTSYHLSVVLDDAAQNITHVIRGADLFAATAIHAALQTLLKIHTPKYCHHELIRDEHGRRLAKRDDARALRKYREDGATPADIRRIVGL